MKGIRLADTSVYLEYNDVIHTITLHGAQMAFVVDRDHPDTWLLEQLPGAKTELLLLHPDWRFE